MKANFQLLGILLLSLIILSMTSCFKGGYGCKGNSRSMTGEGMWKRGSRLN
jgi:hypothetical protein